MKNLHDTPPGAPAETAFLMPSPYDADGGHLVGRLPRDIPLSEFRSLGTPESPIKTIRAKCIDCSGGSETEARKCVAIGCSLWPFRMAHNPFHPALLARHSDLEN